MSVRSLAAPNTAGLSTLQNRNIVKNAITLHSNQSIGIPPLPFSAAAMCVRT